MTEYSWLIEAPGLYYLEVTKDGYFGWTLDPHRALRLHSSAQANAFIAGMMKAKPELFVFARLLSDAKAIEHGFMEPDALEKGGGDDDGQ